MISDTVVQQTRLHLEMSVWNSCWETARDNVSYRDRRELEEGLWRVIHDSIDSHVSFAVFRAGEVITNQLNEHDL